MLFKFRQMTFVITQLCPPVYGAECWTYGNVITVCCQGTGGVGGVGGVLLQHPITPDFKLPESLCLFPSDLNSLL